MFTTIIPNQRTIDKIALDGQILKVEFRAAKSRSGSDNIAGPGRMILVVRMDKLEFVTAEFTEK